MPGKKKNQKQGPNAALKSSFGEQSPLKSDKIAVTTPRSKMKKSMNAISSAEQSAGDDEPAELDYIKKDPRAPSSKITISPERKDTKTPKARPPVNLSSPVRGLKKEEVKSSTAGMSGPNAVLKSPTRKMEIKPPAAGGLGPNARLVSPDRNQRKAEIKPPPPGGLAPNATLSPRRPEKKEGPNSVLKPSPTKIVEPPKVKAPEIKAPAPVKVEPPKVTVPKPEVKVPEVKKPEVKVPTPVKVEPPKVKAPEVKAPEIKQPKIEAPKAPAMPRSEVVKMPPVKAPQPTMINGHQATASHMPQRTDQAYGDMNSMKSIKSSKAPQGGSVAPYGTQNRTGNYTRMDPKVEMNKPLGKQKKTGSKFEMQGSDTNLYRPEFDDREDAKRTNKKEKMWELMSTYLPTNKESIQRQIVNNVEYRLARTRFNFDNYGAYQAAAFATRDRLIESWNDTNAYHKNQDVRRVYYMSLEFLMGRTFQNALVNSDLQDKFREALMDMGYDLEDLMQEETDAALGNGGLGRLAACFIDSLATLEIPAWGYGIRYDYGIFKQQIRDGYQVEIPDFWLAHGNPWEIEREDVTYQIRFYGHSQKYQDGSTERAKWEGCQKVLAMAYDTPIPGFNTYNTNNLRLWRSRPRKNFDFDKFNSSDYQGAIREREEAEYITSVLYPNDSTESGKELRLKQQYFFSSASIYDMVRRYKEKHNDRFAKFSDKNRVQLNDTHPAIATVELLRILIDEEMLSFEEAWGVIYNTFSYTNHTVLPEALEKWSVDLVGNLLPRHLELVYLINHIYMEKLKSVYPGDNKKYERMSIIEEGYPKKIRMAYLAIVCSHTVNGVAALHSRLIKETIFKEFDQLYPDKIQNKTNGVTPRRWIHCCNPALSDLLSDAIGGLDEWIISLENLQQLMPYATDPNFQEAFIKIKRNNKIRLAKKVKETTGFDIPIDSLYDVQVKRIHEYKRQFMNILSVIDRYLRILDTPVHERKDKFQARVVMIGGKAAPGYHNAKAIIKLITAVSYKVNNDASVGDLLKVIFLPNYNVSFAEIIIPATELSQHISTTGTEASGTSNMKFVMNGGLIIGTMDGANVEIAEEIGEDNMFIFGERLEGVNRARKEMYEGKRNYVGQRLRRVFDTVKSGFFGDTQVIHPIIDHLCDGGDHYITCFDFNSYCDAQDRVDKAYKNTRKWNEMAIIGIAKSGKFSSDRTIAEYCGEIWDAQPVPVPNPSVTAATRTRSQPNLANPV